MYYILFRDQKMILPEEKYFCDKLKLWLFERKSNGKNKQVQVLQTEISFLY